MRPIKRLKWVIVVGSLILVIGAAGYRLVSRSQDPDPDFDARVAPPAYVSQHPRVLFDEAHWNVHTASGRYKPFANLIENDGYRIQPNARGLSRRTLNDFNVLVVANALGFKGVVAQLAAVLGVPQLAWGTPEAFTIAECDEIASWVAAGGSLLLIADHAPAGRAAQGLSSRFGVAMGNNFTEDRQHRDPVTRDPFFLVFDRRSDLIGDHAITRGRHPDERIDRVITFTGQSLVGPRESVALLKLSSSAVDVRREDDREADGSSAAGRAQGLALEWGRGRLVVLGEAAMLTSQAVGRGPNRPHIGMSWPGYDNRQFALNIMHWLSHLM